MMKFSTFLGIFFYTVVIVIIGVTLIAFALNILSVQEVHSGLLLLETNLNSRFIIGLVGLLLILVAISFAQAIFGGFQREKTIAFSTASGQVTISLSAVEDIIKRLGIMLPEIKELRPNVVATKKGLTVDVRVILRSEANIPELTSRLQEITSSKLQEVLGLEEQILTRIHVAKIIPGEEKEKRKKETEKHNPTIPFAGYGRL